MLSFLNNLKIQQKLTFAFGGIVLAIVVMSLCVYLGVSGIKKTSYEVERVTEARQAAISAQLYMSRQDAALRAYVMSRVPSGIDAVSQHRSGFNDALDSYILLDPSSKDRAEQARAGVEKWFEAVAVRGVGLTNLADYDSSGLLAPVDTILQELVDARVAEAEELAASQASIVNIMRIVMGIGTVFALTMAGACGVWLTRVVATPLRHVASATRSLLNGDTAVSIPALGRKDEVGMIASAVEHFKQVTIEQNGLKLRNEQMRREAEEARIRREAELEQGRKNDTLVVTALAEGLENLARGNLTFRIEVEFPASAITLKTDFNAAIESVEKAISLVNTNVSVIHMGAEEISAASNDLSNRTEQQAATLEQTAAALDEITATVSRTAEGAKEASKVVLNARDEAQHSGKVVGNAVQAMNAIENSSNRIGAIIGVIDEIAFQTNLLALNAGVEAARAGDAGRGFAVVASEVRALAQRSADAAKEIKALISASGQQVTQGVNLVGQTGEALGRIVDRVAQIDVLVQEIAASAQEQSIGLAQVNSAVNQMDQVTQQNAAMVEESTAACHALASEANELSGSVARFTVSQTLAPMVAKVRQTTPLQKTAAPMRAAMPAAPAARVFAQTPVKPSEPATATAPVARPAAAPEAEAVTIARPAKPVQTANEPAVGETVSPARPRSVAETISALKTTGLGGAAFKSQPAEDGWEEF